jgi:hypothetical protein
MLTSNNSSSRLRLSFALLCGFPAASFAHGQALGYALAILGAIFLGSFVLAAYLSYRRNSWRFMIGFAVIWGLFVINWNYQADYSKRQTRQQAREAAKPENQVPGAEKFQLRLAATQSQAHLPLALRPDSSATLKIFCEKNITNELHIVLEATQDLNSQLKLSLQADHLIPPLRASEKQSIYQENNRFVHDYTVNTRCNAIPSAQILVQLSASEFVQKLELTRIP